MNDEIQIGRAHRPRNTDVGDRREMHKATPLIDEDVHAVPEVNILRIL
jgi:hypothetical protein